MRFLIKSMIDMRVVFLNHKKFFTLFGWVKKREKYACSKQGIFSQSRYLTLTFKLEIWFNVTANLLSVVFYEWIFNTSGLKVEKIRFGNGEKDKQTDGRKLKLVFIGCQPSGILIRIFWAESLIGYSERNPY